MWILRTIDTKGLCVIVTMWVKTSWFIWWKILDKLRYHFSVYLRYIGIYRYEHRWYSYRYRYRCRYKYRYRYRHEYIDISEYPDDIYMNIWLGVFLRFIHVIAYISSFFLVFTEYILLHEYFTIYFSIYISIEI